MTDQIIDDSDLTHDLIFELFKSIPSDIELIISDDLILQFSYILK